MEITGKISVRQTFLLFMATLLSPAVRLFAASAAKEAKQAGWLSPLVAGIALLLLVLIIHNMFKKYPDSSLADMITLILGKPLGKVLLVLYFVLTTILDSIYVQYFSERLTISIYPNIDLHVLIITLIVLVAYVLHSGLVVLARMGEIILPLMLCIFVLVIVLVFPAVELSNLTPVSYLDVLPVMKGSQSMLATFSYIWIFFFLGDKIAGKDKIKKTGLYSTALIVTMIVAMIIICIGSLGASITAKMPLSFFGASKLISGNNILERVESLIVAMWIISDFITVAAFSIVSLKLLKDIFQLKEFKKLIAIYMVLIYFIGNMLSENVFDLEAFSDKILVPLNIAFFLVVPVLLFGVGKLRKKI